MQQQLGAPAKMLKVDRHATTTVRATVTASTSVTTTTTTTTATATSNHVPATRPTTEAQGAAQWPPDNRGKAKCDHEWRRQARCMAALETRQECKAGSPRDVVLGTPPCTQVLRFSRGGAVALGSPQRSRGTGLFLEGAHAGRGHRLRKRNLTQNQQQKRCPRVAGSGHQ